MALAFPAFAQEAETTVRLPEPLKEDQFSEVKSNSPFLRTISIADTYTLRAVTRINGEPLATLYNNETKKTIVVTAEESEQKGLTLLNVLDSERLDGVSARVSFAGEEADIGYQSSQLAPKPQAGGKSSGRSGGDQKKGPSKEDVERYKALDESKQKQLRDYIGQIAKKYPNISREERGNMIRGAMMRLTDGRPISGDSQA